MVLQYEKNQSLFNIHDPAHMITSNRLCEVLTPPTMYDIEHVMHCFAATGQVSKMNCTESARQVHSNIELAADRGRVVDAPERTVCSLEVE